MPKITKKYCVRKNGFYIAWDGVSLTEEPQHGIRVSQTRAKRKYPGYEMIPFTVAYDQWCKARQEAAK